MTEGERGAGGRGLNELDMLLGLDVEQVGTPLALANAVAGIELLAALREARERSGISEADLVERLGEGARLELNVDADPTGGLSG